MLIIELQSFVILQHFTVDSIHVHTINIKNKWPSASDITEKISINILPKQLGGLDAFGFEGSSKWKILVNDKNVKLLTVAKFAGWCIFCCCKSVILSFLIRSIILTIGFLKIGPSLRSNYSSFLLFDNSI